MAWGIFMAGFTLMGMLALVVAQVVTDDGSAPADSESVPVGPELEAEDLKKAA